MPPLGRPPVFADIVEEHFDELDFLWEHREANVFTPDWTLADLAWQEERAEAHLDGLRLAELHGADLARARLGSGEPGAAIAATLVLVAAGEEHLAPIESALRTADPPIVAGIGTALRHELPDALRPALADLLRGGEPPRAAVAADVLAFRREAVPDLRRLLDASDAAVLAVAFAAAGRLGGLRAADLARALEHGEPAVRRAALAAAARQGLAELPRACRAAASRATDPDPEAVAMLGVLGNPADEPVLRAALQRPELGKVATGALGAMGRAASVPLLLELMRDKALGPAATAAYRRITGAGDVEGERPFPPPPVAEGEDEAEELPPDPAKAAADWRRREPSMAADRAFQAGVAIDGAALPAAFDALSLAARRDVFLRLRARHRGIPDLELEALAVRQQAR
jgi:uncharacterized protein (TIGR02270 family)